MIFFNNFVALSLATLGAASSISNRVIGGSAVKISEAPFYCTISSVDRKGRESFRCGSSLVANQTILTSAECFEKGHKFVARCGSDKLHDECVESIPITKIIRHPCYRHAKKDTISNNVALGILKTPVELYENVQIIELDNTPIGDDDNFRVFGHGATVHPVVAGKWNASEELKYLDSRMLSADQCQAYFMSTMKYPGVPVGTFCGNTIEPEGSQCQGDQGGPFINTQTKKQVGVVSFVSEFCAIERPAVYTSIYHFYDFIMANLNLGVN